MSEPIDPKPTPPWFSISNQVIGFCIGMVVCALIILYAPEHYSKISEVLRGFYFMIFGAALFIFIVIVGFRPYVQRYILNRAPNKVRGVIEDMQNVSDHISIQLLDLLPTPPSEDIKTRARAILPGLANLLIWSRLRNWWWQWILGIFVAIGGLMGTILLMNQNDLLTNQNELLSNQNTLIQRQMSLEEANRRSALVVLMSNIMDKVDREIEKQQDLLPKEKRDSARFQLYQSLIGQIAALSHSFKPYRYLSGDTHTLIPEPLSPERGQLLITLTLLPLDTATLGKIYQSATFASAELQGAVLRGANLIGANLRGANLRGADLYGANLRGAYLRGAYLRGAYLSEAYLSEAYLIEADLSGADLRGANLIEANLIKADLSEAYLSEANLIEADLIEADLREADLYGANLIEADLSGANLRGADLSEAYLSEADLSEADLSEAISLKFEMLKSCISLYQCKGLPENILTQLKQEKPELFEKSEGWEIHE